MVKVLPFRCLKSPVSEEPSTSKTVNRRNNVEIWTNPPLPYLSVTMKAINSLGKSLSWWYAKYSDCLLTYWLPMTSILFLIGTIYCNIFRYHHRRNKNFFPTFFLHFQNLDWILNIFKKRMTLIVDVFLNWRSPKYGVR